MYKAAPVEAYSSNILPRLPARGDNSRSPKEKLPVEQVRGKAKNEVRAKCDFARAEGSLRHTELEVT